MNDVNQVIMSIFCQFLNINFPSNTVIVTLQRYGSKCGLIICGTTYHNKLTFNALVPTHNLAI